MAECPFPDRIGRKTCFRGPALQPYTLRPAIALESSVRLEWINDDCQVTDNTLHGM